MGFQLTLGLTLNTKKTFKNFVLGQNFLFFSQLKDRIKREEPFVSFVHSPLPSGKSHFLQAICHELAYQGIQSAYLELNCLKNMNILKGLEQVSFLAFDNYDALSAENRKILDEFILSPVSSHRQILISGRDLDLIENIKDVKNLIPYFMLALDQDDLSTLLKIKIEELGLSLPDDIQELILKQSDGDIHLLIDQIKKIEKHCDLEKKKLSVRYARMLLQQEQTAILES